ncbi:MAG: glycosyltransferase [Cyanobacterium sp. T60_A2020_053]|nr:glycosyltransferase [Cyanobacterium sp. T60_A2020_053]
MKRQTRFYVYPASSVIFLIITGLVTLCGLWWGGNQTLIDFFGNFYLFQEIPSQWLRVPQFQQSYFLFLPTVIVAIIVTITTKISPQQKLWSRWLMISILLLFMGRYLVWRCLSSLNLIDPVTGIFSLALLAIELFFVASPLLQNILMLKLKFRNHQADKMQQTVIIGQYQPSVDILIPTYNEPAEIIKKTIIACQNIDYDNKIIYLLDDGDRHDIAKLACQLDCEYITRSDNLHAKAGNLNHALELTNGELIAVFDADFMPQRPFLSRTVGFFQKAKIALIQTYQSFYTPDPVARNLGLENDFPPDVEIFSRHYQVIRDSWGSALCYGSSFVVRRQYLMEVGGFCQNSLSEDYHTGVKLAAQGYEVIYLNESLSAGLTAENIFGHIRQRQRWARGTMQSLFIPENPLTIKGLSFGQRLTHFEGIMQWFTSPLRILIFFLPLAYTAGIIPIKASVSEIIYFVLPYYFLQVGTFAWLNFKSRSAMISEIYNIITTFPVAWEIVQTLITPFSSIFKVTPKGTKSDSYYFNWSLATPLFFVFAVNIVNLISIIGFIKAGVLGEFNTAGGIGLILFWNVYNIGIIALSLWALLDVPKPENYQWFKVCESAKIIYNGYIYDTIITQISDQGVEIKLNFRANFRAEDNLEVMMDNFCVKGAVSSVKYHHTYSLLKINFELSNLAQFRQLINKIYGQNNIWSTMTTPSEIKTVYFLFKSLFTTPIKWLYFQSKLRKNLPNSVSTNLGNSQVKINTFSEK